jgi:hypothetical protein
MAQEVDCLLDKLKDLSSNPSTKKKKKKESTPQKSLKTFI